MDSRNKWLSGPIGLSPHFLLFQDNQFVMDTYFLTTIHNFFILEYFFPQILVFILFCFFKGHSNYARMVF